MSQSRQETKILEISDDEIIPRRSFITNRKTQLILNVVLVIIIVILVVLIFRKEDEIEKIRAIKHTKNSVATIESTTHAEAIIPLELEQNYKPPIPANNLMAMEQINIISRDDWFARDWVGNLTTLMHPIENIIISHTATDECTSQAGCMTRIRSVQKADQTLHKFQDIRYNFLVGGDGLIYEGRGWDKQGSSTQNHNAISMSIAFIGNFEHKSPTIVQVNAAQQLIAHGERMGKLHWNYLVFPEKYFSNTESPGKEIVKIIKNWPHYCTPPI